MKIKSSTTLALLAGCALGVVAVNRQTLPKREEKQGSERITVCGFDRALSLPAGRYGTGEATNPECRLDLLP
jgi:hypothetical protein